MFRSHRRLIFAAKFLLGLAAAAAVLTAFILATAAFFRPDLTRRPAMPSAAKAAAAQHARTARLDPAHPTVIWRDVDYREGARGRWWPKGESPILAELVCEGKLPPLAQRVGPEPLVLAGVDGQASKPNRPKSHVCRRRDRQPVRAAFSRHAGNHDEARLAFRPQQLAGERARLRVPLHFG